MMRRRAAEDRFAAWAVGLAGAFFVFSRAARILLDWHHK
jgi:hypothetical protein